MPSPFYLFIHIPKTAGTTLRSILDLQYGRKNVLTYYNQTSAQLLENLNATLKVGRHGYRALIGHFPYGPHDKLETPSKYVTILRDPVTRAISSYYENAKSGSPAVRRDNGEVMDLRECIENKQQFFANQQLKMLIGKNTMDVLDNADLQTASDNFARDFLFTGISEYFDASILLLSKRLGWRPCIYGRLNTGVAQTGIENRVLESLKELNQLEIELYEERRELLLRKMRREGRRFDSALGQLVAASSAAFKKFGGASGATEITGKGNALKSYLGG